MIREYTSQVLVNKTVKEIHCDDCDSIIPHRSSSSICEICGKDICRKCIGYNAPTMGDYSEVYCRSCFEIKMKYDELIKPFEDKIEELHDKMIAECKSKFLNKSK